MDYDDWRAVCAPLRLPAALLDLDAVDANLALITSLLGPDQTLRIASKSLRCPGLMRYLLEAGGDALRGLMTFSAHETAWLAANGFDDLLLAYPIAREDEARALVQASQQAELWVTVDAVDQVALLGREAHAAGVTLRLCIDVDVSWRPRWLAGRAHFGVRRSPIRSGADAVVLADAIARTSGVRLDAVLAYEAQIAGVRDRSPGADPLAPIKRIIKARSVPLAARRRAEVVDALRDAGHPVTLVNGGGSGSLLSTARDGVCTELTAGSGLVCSHLFDGYDGLPFRPALFFALGVVRRSDPDHITCAGGGYIASGPAGADRLPVVHAPRGLEPVVMEGFGEVQTPFRLCPDAPALGLGDPVVCRHAKAGELAERVERYHLIRGGERVGTLPTLRGEGVCFF